MATLGNLKEKKKVPVHVWYRRQQEICLREKHFVEGVGEG